MKKISYKKGQAVVVAVMLFLASSLLATFGITSSTLNDVKSSGNLQKSKESFALSESLLEDITYRIKSNKSVSPVEILTIDNSVASGTVSEISGNQKNIFVSGDVSESIRNIEADITMNSAGSFNYGIQTGVGGVTFSNSSSVVGNLYSNGPIVNTGSGTVWSAVSAGPNGLIDGIRTTGDAYAHTIKNSTIGRNAYYQVKQNTTVSGTSYPASSDLSPLEMPVSDAKITEWEGIAQAGGIIDSCPYIVTGNVTIGPKKINCDFYASNDAVITLTGHLWVYGNLNISNTSKFKISSSLSGVSVSIIADKTTNRNSSSRIFVSNSAVFEGSGTDSYIFLISMNDSAQNGGGYSAMTVSNSVSGDVSLYAPYGSINISNSVNLVAVTAYIVSLSNSAKITYKSGVANAVFDSGPSGGGYSISGWQEQ